MAPNGMTGGKSRVCMPQCTPPFGTECGSGMVCMSHGGDVLDAGGYAGVDGYCMQMPPQDPDVSSVLSDQEIFGGRPDSMPVPTWH